MVYQSIIQSIQPLNQSLHRKNGYSSKKSPLETEIDCKKLFFL
jgi:hypothetical protein